MKQISFEEKLKLVLKYPEMIEAIADVLIFGASKHKDEGWLDKDGYSMDRKGNFDSKNHHAAAHFAGVNLDESGLMHLAHEGTRALMELTRLKRGITHTKDAKKAVEPQITG